MKVIYNIIIYNLLWFIRYWRVLIVGAINRFGLLLLSNWLSIRLWLLPILFLLVVRVCNLSAFLLQLRCIIYT